MPALGQVLDLASGATSANQFANSTYQTVSPGTRLVVSAGSQDATGALKNGTNPEVTYTFRVNAVDLATAVTVPIITDGTVISSQNTACQLNAFTCTAATNRPFLTFTNGSSANRFVTFFVNIQTGQSSIGGV
jgi:hypothetical protein